MLNKRKVKTILVTGGAGFIGSAFIRSVLKQKDFSGQIINFDLLTYAASLESLQSIASDPRYFFYKGNIVDQKKLLALFEKFKIDACVHFAAETHVDNSIRTPDVFFKTNVEGTFQLLECIRKRPEVHFHHISTDEVFGSIEKGAFTEKSPYQPKSPYAASKAAADHLVRAYANTYQLSTTISNCSNNYGPFQHSEKLIPQMIKKALLKQKLPIYGEGANVRDWLFVEDHVAAIWQILNTSSSGETYNIGGNGEKNNLEMVKLLLKLIAESLKLPKADLFSLISFVADRPGHDFRYAIDFSKIKKRLNWQPKVNLEEGLRQTVNWYLTNQQWLLASQPLQKLIDKKNLFSSNSKSSLLS